MSEHSVCTWAYWDMTPPYFLHALSFSLKYYSFFLFFYFSSSFVCADTKVVGPLLAAPAKPLHDELEEFMQRSGSEGVILVSFGTILGNIDEKLLALLADALSRVPYQVIWKLHRGKAFVCVLYTLFSR